MLQAILLTSSLLFVVAMCAALGGLAIVSRRESAMEQTSPPSRGTAP